MKLFNTLKGFLEGHEGDDVPYFAHLATLRIFGSHLDLEQITQNLGIEPSRTHRKGDKKGPRSPGCRHDMWSYTAQVSEERPLADHIDALWESVRHAEAYLRDLKNTATVDVFLGYRTTIDHAGIEVPHASLEVFSRLEIPLGVSIIVT